MKYVDFGTKTIANQDDLHLATMFIDLPILAHQCCIPKVQCDSKSGKWSSLILNQFKSYMQQEFCAIHIESNGSDYKHLIPCSIDPIYAPYQAYDWLRKEQLVYRIDFDSENNEILYVG